MESKRVTVVLFPDEDGGYTAVVPYLSCQLIAQGHCFTAQGETADEALSVAHESIITYLRDTGADGRYFLEQARLEELEVRELEIDVDIAT